MLFVCNFLINLGLGFGDGYDLIMELPVICLFLLCVCKICADHHLFLFIVGMRWVEIEGVSLGFKI